LANPADYLGTAKYVEFLQAYDPVSASTRDRWDEMGIEIWGGGIILQDPSYQLADVLCKMAEMDLHIGSGDN